MKELSRQEAKDFNVFAHKYLNYIREASDKNQPTLLAKIVGKNADTNLLLKTVICASPIRLSLRFFAKLIIICY